MYNILTEKWIPVVDNNNNLLKCSLTETILNAHRYKELMEPDCILECALYRFLFTFVSDMVTEWYEDDDICEVIEELLDEGSFPEEMLKRYLEICDAEGTSFDLFDKENPFMQNGVWDYENDGKIESAAILSPRAASGTNKLFVNHIPESEYSITCEEAVKQLLAGPPFTVVQGKGWRLGNLGSTPPVYTYINGKDLFHTIVFNLFENKGKSRTEWNKVRWRTDMKNVIKDQIAPPYSTYAGMHFPWRSIQLIQDEDGRIRNIRRAQGFKRNEAGKDLHVFDDPFIAYITKAGEKTFEKISDHSESSWMYIIDVFTPGSESIVVRNYHDVHHKEKPANVELASYTTAVNGKYGSFIEAWKSQVIFPKEVLDVSSDMLEFISGEVHYARRKGSTLYKTIRDQTENEKEAAEMENEFYAMCKGAFSSRFLTDILDQSRDRKSVKEAWEKQVTGFAVRIYDRCIIDPARDQKALIEAYKNRRFLFDREKIHSQES